jgi:hypothetical protein
MKIADEVVIVTGLSLLCFIVEFWDGTTSGVQCSLLE